MGSGAISPMMVVDFCSTFSPMEQSRERRSWSVVGPSLVLALQFASCNEAPAGTGNADGGPVASNKDSGVVLPTNPPGTDGGKPSGENVPFDAGQPLDAGSGSGDSDAGTTADACLGQWCESFETGSPTVSNRDCSGSGTVSYDATQARSGKRSLHIVGAAGYCNHAMAGFSMVPAIAGSTWMRFFIRLKNALGPEHITFLSMRDDADNKRDFRMGGQSDIVMFNRESDDATLPALSPTGIGLSQRLPALTWVCVEMRLDPSQGSLDTFIDGQAVAGLKLDETATPDVDEQWLRKRWRPKLGDLRLGWESYGNGANEVWFDDVAMGSRRFGCGP